MDFEGSYNFYFCADDFDTGENVELTLDNVKVFENPLGTHLEAFERFLKACGFVLDNRHLELVDD